MSLLNKDLVASIALHVLSQCGVRHLPLPVTAHSKPFPGTELCILHRLHGTYSTSVHTAYSVHTVYCILCALHCMSHSVELDCVLLDCVLHCVLHCKAAISALVPTHSLVCEGNAKHSWACYMRTLVMRCCTVLVCKAQHFLAVCFTCIGLCDLLCTGCDIVIACKCTWHLFFTPIHCPLHNVHAIRSQAIME